MMLSDSKVSNLSCLPVEENHLLPDFPPIKSQLIPQAIEKREAADRTRMI